VAEAVMRGLKSLGVLVVVLGGLVAYIYFVESKRPAGGPDAVETKEKVFTVASDKIQELTVKASNGDRTVLKKSGTAWELVEPEKLAADEAEVSGLTSGLSSLEIQRVVEEQAADLKGFGLDTPRIEVGFKAEGDKDLRTVRLGDKTPTGGDMYAMLAGQKRVFLVSGYLDSTFDRTTFSLREKSALKFDRAKADSLEVVTADRTIKLAKAGEEWKLVGPVTARTDFGAVEAVVSRLQTSQMKAIVAPQVKDPKEYGFDKPEAIARVGAGSAMATLTIGKRTDDGTYYALDGARPMVFTVESGLLDDLKKPADDLRRKDVFEFRSYNATRLEVTRGAETLALEKYTAKTADGKGTEDKWRLLKPEARELESAKVDTLLSRLTSLRAQSFTDPAAKEKTKTGLEAPVAVVQVAFDEGKKQDRVTFGKADSDVYAGRPDEAGAAKLLSYDWDEIVKAIDELKQKPEPKKDAAADAKKDEKPKQ